ncbi:MULTISPECIES: nucleotidyltransferase family protein [unclassified Bradyrhizobium]|uniref:nucleotidyltransferase family protein n=1 Tax=unclassified Bradyrhizobium TaxID=2631580 RepID=UPI002FEECC99
MPPCSAPARGDARPDSDIDILVEIAPDVRMDVFKYVGIVRTIEDLFPVRVERSEAIHRAARKDGLLRRKGSLAQTLRVCRRQ